MPCIVCSSTDAPYIQEQGELHDGVWIPIEPKGQWCKNCLPQHLQWMEKLD